MILKGLRAKGVRFGRLPLRTSSHRAGSFCTAKLDPSDVDGYWVEPDDGVHDRIDTYWIDFEVILVPQVRKWKWRIWADHGVGFYIHFAMRGKPTVGFPEFVRQDQEGLLKGVIRVVRSKSS